MFLSFHALVNLANLANSAMSKFTCEPGERSEPQVLPGSLVNLANLVTASKPFLVYGHECYHQVFSWRRCRFSARFSPHPPASSFLRAPSSIYLVVVVIFTAPFVANAIISFYQKGWVGVIIWILISNSIE